MNECVLAEVGKSPTEIVAGDLAPQLEEKRKENCRENAAKWEEDLTQKKKRERDVREPHKIASLVRLLMSGIVPLNRLYEMYLLMSNSRIVCTIHSVLWPMRATAGECRLAYYR